MTVSLTTVRWSSSGLGSERKSFAGWALLNLGGLAGTISQIGFAAAFDDKALAAVADAIHELGEASCRLGC